MPRTTSAGVGRDASSSMMYSSSQSRARATEKARSATPAASVPTSNTTVRRDGRPSGPASLLTPAPPRDVAGREVHGQPHLADQVVRPVDRIHHPEDVPRVDVNRALHVRVDEV